MKIDRQKFMDAYVAAFGTPKPDAQAGLDALLTAAEADQDITDIRWLAYMLATVKHECANTWRPIEEYGKGQGRKYGVPVTVTDADGRSYTNVYYGRGFVQLTWKDNYQTMGQVLKNRLVYEPSLALQADVAYRIMSHGMRKGSFTGKKLGDYITASGCDYVNARKIINGLDQAEKIAGYATKLEAALRASVVAAVPGGVPTPQPATPAAPPAAPAAGQAFSVAADSLNVRSGPGASNGLVAGSPLARGTQVEGFEDNGGWKRITAANGVAGWVSAQYLAPVSAPAAPAVPAAAGPVFTVTADSLNVRSGPAASNALVAGSPLAKGTQVEGLEDNGGWKRIKAANGVTGWVSAQYLAAAVPAGV
ncbi:MAG TPA: SH3 domain-containing protein [Longimicrobium sp.]|nr:SH3 domain-containing protein [Longimicrobium sp.]